MFTNAQGPTRDNYARKEKAVARKVGASRKSGNSRQAIAHIAHACLTQAETLITRWLPGGRREGKEWVTLNPTRPDAHPGSFKVNLDTGKWADFATGDKGGDLVTLYAYLYKLTHSEAARLLATELGVADYDHSPRRARSSKADWTPITPVPDNAAPPPKAHYRHGTPACVWTYRDA